MATAFIDRELAWIGIQLRRRGEGAIHCQIPLPLQLFPRWTTIELIVLVFEGNAFALETLFDAAT